MDRLYARALYQVMVSPTHHPHHLSSSQYTTGYYNVAAESPMYTQYSTHEPGQNRWMGNVIVTVLSCPPLPLSTPTAALFET